MNKLNIFRNESGLTLIEVVVSILILTLIITSFLMMFIQATKTNKASERIIDSTYYAQVEMENIHAISDTSSFEDRKTIMNKHLKYETLDLINFIKNDGKSGKYFEVRLLERNELPIVDLLVKVYDSKGGNLEAQMETVLLWEGRQVEEVIKK